MNAIVSLLVGAAVAVAATAPAETKAPAKKAPVPASPAAAKPNPPKLPPSFTDKMDKLKAAVGLTDEQVAAIGKLRAARDEDLTKRMETSARRIALAKQHIATLKGAQAQRAAADLTKFEKQVQAILATENSTHERKLFEALTREQRGKWNSPVLVAEVAKEYKPLNLTDEQMKQLTALCGERGAEMAVPADPKVHEGVIMALRGKAFSTVLTADQRRQLVQTRSGKKPPARSR